MADEVDQPAEGGTIAVTPGPPARVVLVGDFDVANTADTMEAFAAVPAGDVILDLRHVTFCSSAFLSCLLHLQRRTVRNGHRIEVAAVSPVVSRLLTLTATADLFPPTDR
jgi:anti-sigma B factor antagonist